MVHFLPNSVGWRFDEGQPGLFGFECTFLRFVPICIIIIIIIIPPCNFLLIAITL
jgi:hypothetical protein